jgi:hypothetical protein
MTDLPREQIHYPAQMSPLHSALEQTRKYGVISTMKATVLAIATLFLTHVAQSVYAQYLPEHLNDSFYQSTVAILGCTTETRIPLPLDQTNPATIDKWRTFGTGALFFVPAIGAQSNLYYYTVVTARHNLFYAERDKTNILDTLYMKLNALPSSQSPRYIRVPLLTTPSTNFWLSQRNNDLAVIPIPPSLVPEKNSALSTHALVTAQNFREKGILPGCPTVAAVLQLKYFDDTDLRVPENIPIFRCGHLARLGLYTHSETNQFSRDHVIDLHSSHGNSGATVIAIAEDGSPMFLGIVQGFIQDQDAFIPYDAPVTEKSSLVLIDQQTEKTNSIAMTYYTEANPSLTLVTPVDELSNLNSSPTFLAAATTMAIATPLYRTFNTNPFPKP